MQRLKFWLFLLAAAVLAGRATGYFLAENGLDGMMNLLGCIGWFILALRAFDAKSDAEILRAGENAKSSLRGVFSEAKFRIAEHRKVAWSKLLEQLRQCQNESVVSVVDISSNENCKARIILSNHQEAVLMPMMGGKLEVRRSGADWEQGEPCADISEVVTILSLWAKRNHKGLPLK